MTRSWLAHLNLELGGVGHSLFFSAENVKSGGFQEIRPSPQVSAERRTDP